MSVKDKKEKEDKENKMNEGYRSGKALPNSINEKFEGFMDQATDMIDGVLGVEKPVKEDFIPFFMSNGDFETTFDSPLKTSKHNKLHHSLEFSD